jgi:hypothetical protein
MACGHLVNSSSHRRYKWSMASQSLAACAVKRLQSDGLAALSYCFPSYTLPDSSSSSKSVIDISDISDHTIQRAKAPAVKGSALR